MDRGYVYERGRALIPSWLAFSVTKLLETNFPSWSTTSSPPRWKTALTASPTARNPAATGSPTSYFGSGEGAARNADEAHEGLQQQVAQLGEIDARAINTIDIGDGLHVRGRPLRPVSGRHGASGRRRQPEARVSAGHHRAG